MHGDIEEIVLDHKKVKIDKCIVPYVKALNTNGIRTSISCCGHGEIDGSVITIFEGQYRLVTIGPSEEGTPKRFKDEFQKYHEKNGNLKAKEE